MSKLLIVVDMQVDFVDGSLGTPQAQAIVPNVCEKIRDTRVAGDYILFTRDTHGHGYFETQEGRRLPVKHCILGTPGHEIVPAVKEEIKAGDRIIDKPSFGHVGLGLAIDEYMSRGVYQTLTEIELIGLCTGICVISNAMILKATFPEIPVAVDANCCACVSKESHETALAAMKTCQIDVFGS